MVIDAKTFFGDRTLQPALALLPEADDDYDAELRRLVDALGVLPSPRVDNEWARAVDAGGVDYAGRCGLTPDDWPVLLELAGDWTLTRDYWEQDADEPVDPRGWAAVHAWRALLQMSVPASVDALLMAFTRFDADNEWVFEDLVSAVPYLEPALLARLKEAVLAGVGSRSDEVCDLRRALAEAVGKVSDEAPVPGGIELLDTVLAGPPTEDPWLNGLWVSAGLRRKRLVEHAESVERWFFEDRVDESLCGDWSAVTQDAGIALPTALDLARPVRRIHWWPYLQHVDEQDIKESRVAERRYIVEKKRELAAQERAKGAPRQPYKKRKKRR